MHSSPAAFFLQSSALHKPCALHLIAHLSVWHVAAYQKLASFLWQVQHITSCFCDAVQIPITVVYLDRSMAAFTGHSADDAAVNLHNFVPEALQSKTGAVVKPRIHLLYRPGHYDILYPRAAA